MKKASIAIAAIGAIFLAWLGVMWCLWTMWRWVLPQVYANGPDNIVAPGFWLFAAAWTLVSLIGKSIFGSSSSK